MSQPSFVAIVLAAGLGTRMKSTQAKVMHEVAERPLVGWAVGSALAAGASRAIAVVGHQREVVETYLNGQFGSQVVTAVQEEQRGTGDAVRCALPALESDDQTVVILYGDCPLIEKEAIASLIAAKQAAPLAMLVSNLDNPTGYGRILRDGTRVVGIREQKDATPAERKIQEVNPGVYAIDAAFLRSQIDQLESQNAAGELYLTDLVARAAETSDVVALPWDIESLRGINDRSELAEAEQHMQRRIQQRHGAAGVTMRHAASCWIGADVTLAADVTLEAGVVLRGKTNVEAGARLDAGAVIDNSQVAEGAWIKPHSVVTDSVVGPAAQVGPFAHLRPGTDLGPKVRIGNFVETKKTTMAEGAKANHLAYLGDGIVGRNANIGAGTIFCNYDGAKKHTTRIEEDVFVGSDSQLVAPITLGKGSYVATGTTVTRNVPADALAVGRAKQENKEGYAKRLRARLGIKPTAEKEK